MNGITVEGPYLREANMTMLPLSGARRSDGLRKADQTSMPPSTSVFRHLAVIDKFNSRGSPAGVESLPSALPYQGLMS